MWLPVKSVTFVDLDRRGQVQEVCGTFQHSKSGSQVVARNTLAIYNPCMQFQRALTTKVIDSHLYLYTDNERTTQRSNYANY